MTTIQMPQLGETIVEGTILKWLKDEGESVQRDEPLFEISTDKVDTEVPSPVAGTVDETPGGRGHDGARRHRCDGDRRRLRDVGVRAGSAPRPPAAGTAPSTAAAPAARPPRPRRRCPLRSRPLAAPAAQMPDRGPRSQILSPIVRRLARERGVDLATVAGSGEGGRITKARRPGGDRLAPRRPPAARRSHLLPSLVPAAAPLPSRRRRRRARARTCSRYRTSARRSPRTCSRP